MEPSLETLAEIGRLCSAWSFLEAVTEHTLWGILKADERWGKIVSDRLDLQGFWQQILKYAPEAVSSTDLAELKSINKDVVTVTHDRNIIAHGRVHTMVRLPPGSQSPIYTVLGPVGASYDFIRIPCWTIFKGASAGKNFPISTKAVEIVRCNVQKVADRVKDFNRRFGHFKGRLPGEDIVTAWPTPLQ
jgi:hypothetical protein